MIWDWGGRGWLFVCCEGGPAKGFRWRAQTRGSAKELGLVCTTHQVRLTRLYLLQDCSHLMPLRLRLQLLFRSSQSRCYSSSTRFRNVKTVRHEDGDIFDSDDPLFDKDRPLVFRAYFRSMPVISNWFTVSEGVHRLNTRHLEPFGEIYVPLELTGDAQFEPCRGPLSLLIRHMTSLQESDLNLYLAQCSLEDLPSELSEQLPMPDLVYRIGKGDVYGSSLWMGRPPTYTPFHRDPNPNLFVQLAGTKVVRLMAPNVGQRVYKRVGKGDANLRGDEMMVGDERAKMDEEVWGEGADEPSEGWEAKLQSGDGLYIPLGWWHSVRGVDEGRMGANASVSLLDVVLLGVLIGAARSIGGSDE